MQHTFADSELTSPLRITPAPRLPRIYYFTFHHLDELAGYVAAEANHAPNKKLAQELQRLYARIAEVLDAHSDQNL